MGVKEVFFFPVSLSPSLTWKWSPCLRPQPFCSFYTGLPLATGRQESAKKGQETEGRRLQNVRGTPISFPPVGIYFIRLFGELGCSLKTSKSWILTH